MKKFLIIILLISIAVAGTIEINNFPGSISASNETFEISFNVTCTELKEAPCSDDKIEVYYMTDFGVERTLGWLRDSTLQKGKLTWKETDCIFTEYNHCRYENKEFQVSENTINPKIKILAKKPDNKYIETKWISIEHQGQQAEEPAQENEQTEQNEEQETEKQNEVKNETETEEQSEESNIFTSIWNWLLDFLGLEQNP